MYNNLSKEAINKLKNLIGKRVRVKYNELELGYAGKCIEVSKITKGILVNFIIDVEAGLILVLKSKENLIKISNVTGVGDRWGFKYFNIFKNTNKYLVSNTGMKNLISNLRGDEIIAWDK